MDLAGRVIRCLATMLVLSLFAVGCETAPITGRNQLVLLSAPHAAEMGEQAYRQILSQNKVVEGTSFSEAVQRVGQRLTQAVDGDQAWTFNVLQDATPNAFALPGGKVGVHTGLADVVENEAQLAAVLGHEIAHVTARHSAERVSRQLLVEQGISGVGQMTGTGALPQLAAAAATFGVILPFSRSQEAEADEIGLHYMARAGYDPRAAVDVWRNFEKLGGERAPEFLSTHPAPGNRIAKLESLLPQVMSTYEAARRR